MNSGKSTFVNRFLWYIGYRHQGAVHYKRAVGGVTRSPVRLPQYVEVYLEHEFGEVRGIESISLVYLFISYQYFTTRYIRL